MRKYLGLILSFLPSLALASGHLEARRADIITVGTLPNSVLDNSSVTKLGPNPSFQAISGLVRSSNTDSGNIGGLVQNGVGVIFSSMTAGYIPSGSGNSGVIFSSMTSGYIPSGSGNTGVISSSMTTGFIGSGSGNTGVITSTMIASGVIPAASARIYNVIVGTPGMPGTDFNIAVSTDLWAPLSACGANGLTGSLPGGTSVHCRIMFTGPNFNIMNATKPAGVTFAMIPGSSSSWKPLASEVGGTSSTILTIYGNGSQDPDLENFVIDASSLSAFSGRKVIVSSNVRINGLTMLNFKMTAAATANHHAFSVTLATNVIINDFYIDNWMGKTDQTLTWDGNAIEVDLTTGVIFNRPRFGKWIGSGTSTVGLYFARSVGWEVNDMLAENAQGAFLVIDGSCLNFKIKGGDVHINGPYAVDGIIIGKAQNYASSSTGTISGITFYHEAGGSNQPIVNMVSAGGTTSGVDIVGNTFYNKSGGTPTAIATGSNDTFILYNFPRGMAAVTDTGARTRIIQ